MGLFKMTFMMLEKNYLWKDILHLFKPNSLKKRAFQDVVVFPVLK